MKKTVFAFLAVSLCMAACQVEIVDPNESNVSGDVLSAQIEQNEATKTVLGESNNVLWSENDQIVAFMKSSYGHKYQIKPSFAGKTYADFSRISSASGDDLSAGMEWDHNVAYYPYSESIECVKSGDNYTLEVVLPAEQTYEENSFGNGTFPMVAVSEDNNITFKNVCGGIKLQLKGTQIVKSITIQGKNNEKLSGAATVTAYTDETKPAIVMAEDASPTVTLNCGDGVQLSESIATEFIIALPPVLFSQGFTMTVTNTDSQIYTVETDKANTVLRSSILTMPAVTLGQDPENGDDDNSTYVELIVLVKTSLTMSPGTSYTIESEIDPVNVTDPTLTWSSSNNTVATVDQSGKITAVADGTATITVLAMGGATATCEVTVKSAIAVADKKYIVDDADYGYGIVIGDVVWAPVNCGYEPANGDYKGYPYGKLYQWGRKYGQDYPSGENLVAGPVMPSVGKSDENADVFFTAPESPQDWCMVRNDAFWNAGTESSPVKTETDPCPTGWRVPTYKELKKLMQNYSSLTTNSTGQNGRYFSGEYTLVGDAPQLFLPCAGRVDYNGSTAGRYTILFSIYWSSTAYGYDAYCLYYDKSDTKTKYEFRALGASVRCVQE